MSFYAVLAVPSFILLILILVTRIYGSDAVYQHVIPFLNRRLGPENLETIRYLVVNVKKFDPQQESIGLFSALVMALGVGGFTEQLKDSVETVWGKRTNVVSPIDKLKEKAWALAIAVFLGIMALASMGARIAARAWLNVASAESIAGGLVTAMIAAVLYKLVPPVAPRWRDVIPGALVTASLLALGRSVDDWYLIHHGVADLPDAAGRILAFLLWSYFFCQIFLFGAEFTRVLAEYREGPLQAREAA